MKLTDLQCYWCKKQILNDEDWIEISLTTDVESKQVHLSCQTIKKEEMKSVIFEKTHTWYTLNDLYLDDPELIDSINNLLNLCVSRGYIIKREKVHA